MIGIFLDSETNGLNPSKHHILEIAFKLVELTTGKVLASYSSIIQQSKESWNASNLKSLEINGFSWNLVSKGLPEEKVKEQILEIFSQNKINNNNSVFICQNPSFDRSFFSQLIDQDLQSELNWPYHWLDFASMFFATRLFLAKTENASFPWETGFTKDLIAKTYRLPSEEKPHRALNGVDHLLLCYERVLGFPFKRKAY